MCWSLQQGSQNFMPFNSFGIKYNKHQHHKMDKHTQTIRWQKQSLQYQNWKANKYSILVVTEVSESSTRTLKLYAI